MDASLDAQALDAPADLRKMIISAAAVKPEDSGVTIPINERAASKRGARRFAGFPVIFLSTGAAKVAKKAADRGQDASA